jgi:hypothetical protein
MSPTLLAAVLASALAAPAPDEPIKLPQGQAPATVVASMAKDGNIEITQTQNVPVIEERTRTVNTADGRVVTEKYAVTIMKTVQVTHRIKTEGVKVSTADGKAIDVKDLPDKLRKPTIILLATDGNKVDPFYLKIVKADTLVVVPPAPKAETIAPVRPGGGEKIAPPVDKLAAEEEAKRAVEAERRVREEEARAEAAKREAIKREEAAKKK